MIPSTRPFPLGGGSLAPAVAAEHLPEISDIAVLATIEAIHRPIPNTVTGELPTIRSDLGPDQLSAIVPLTLVDIRVHSILGNRPGVGSPRSGDVLRITVAGGWLDFVLDEAAIETLGILNVAPGAVEGPGQIPNEVTPQAPYPFRLVQDTPVYLETGDTVVLFLSHGTIPTFHADNTALPPEPRAITWISGGQTGAYLVPDINGVPSFVTDLAAQLSQQAGKRREVWQVSP